MSDAIRGSFVRHPLLMTPSIRDESRIDVDVGFQTKRRRPCLVNACAVPVPNASITRRRAGALHLFLSLLCLYILHIHIYIYLYMDIIIYTYIYIYIIYTCIIVVYIQMCVRSFQLVSVTCITTLCWMSLWVTAFMLRDWRRSRVWWVRLISVCLRLLFL